MRLTKQQKESVIKHLQEVGVLMVAAKRAGITKAELQAEMKKSAIFRKRINEAKSEGKTNIADNALAVLMQYAYGDPGGKTDRNKLTAAIALANAFEPGFRGTVQGKIDHDVRVITAVPRPNYPIIEPEEKLLDKPPDKMLQLGKRTKKVEILDKDGNYIGTQTVEEAIEGEVINGDS